MIGNPGGARGACGWLAARVGAVALSVAMLTGTAAAQTAPAEFEGTIFDGRPNPSPKTTTRPTKPPPAVAPADPVTPTGPTAPNGTGRPPSRPVEPPVPVAPAGP